MELGGELWLARGRAVIWRTRSLLVAVVWLAAVRGPVVRPSTDTDDGAHHSGNGGRDGAFSRQFESLPVPSDSCVLYLSTSEQEAIG